MKKHIAILGMLCVGVANAQQDPTHRVGINTSDPKATLDIRENKTLPADSPQGVLFPHFTTAERSVFTGVREGTMIYNTTKRCWEIYTLRNLQLQWQCMSF